MKTTYAMFDAAAYLDNDTVIAEYLSAAAQDINPDVFIFYRMPSLNKALRIILKYAVGEVEENAAAGV